MATRVFSGEELERLRGFGEITREELVRFFTLTPADAGFLDPGRACESSLDGGEMGAYGGRTAANSRD